MYETKNLSLWLKNGDILGQVRLQRTFLLVNPHTAFLDSPEILELVIWLWIFPINYKNDSYSKSRFYMLLIQLKKM